MVYLQEMDKRNSWLEIAVSYYISIYNKFCKNLEIKGYLSTKQKLSKEKTFFLRLQLLHICKKKSRLIFTKVSKNSYIIVNLKCSKKSILLKAPCKISHNSSYSLSKPIYKCILVLRRSEKNSFIRVYFARETPLK